MSKTVKELFDRIMRARGETRRLLLIELKEQHPPRLIDQIAAEVEVIEGKARNPGRRR